MKSNLSDDILSKLNENNFGEVFRMIERSFPKDEYRPFDEQKELLRRDEYQIYVHNSNRSISAILAVWDFFEFSFLEHFAVKENNRNSGLGSKLLNRLLVMQNKPVILEVELPQTELARRRIAFYERNGFQQNPYSYLQPSISQGRKEIPLMIMSYPRTLNQFEFEKVKGIIYQNVYGLRT